MSPNKSFTHFFLSVLAPALQIQYVLSYGFLFSLAVSLFYYFLNDPRYPKEQPWLLLLGLGLSIGSYVLGTWLIKVFNIKNHVSIRRGAWIVTLTWIIACTISAIVFFAAGFPIPSQVENFSIFRRFVDGWYEAMSGFTTTGTTILPSVEVFTRGLLTWRSLTHWYGGMGIAYLAVTLWKNFAFRRAPIINSEAESPNHVEFKDEKEALQSGYDFLKAYGLLTIVLIVLLYVSGMFFRSSPYLHWYDNAFESVNYAASTLGTGGFGVHDASEGLPVFENGQLIIGGLRNKVSDWIIGFFMFFSGMNFSLWYLLFYTKKWKTIWKNTELRIYFLFCTSIVLSIWYILVQHNVYPSIWEALRYSLFNMATIVSTTGLANWDFHTWPASAQGILFICYLVGGMVGSTAGGLKILRYVVSFKYLWNEITNLITGKSKKVLSVDGITYDRHQAGLIAASMGLYYFMFLFGAILLMVFSSKMHLVDGSVKNLDFATAVGSSIANLGNIGPAVSIGSVNAGPTGNYFSFSEMGKIIMIVLMYVGRVGILSFLMLFITARGEEQIRDSVAETEFDQEKPRLRA